MIDDMLCVLVTWDESDGRYVVCEDSVNDDLYDVLRHADLEPHVEDVGIGPYEYWGSREVDSRIEVTEVSGEVRFQIVAEVELSPADEGRVDRDVARSEAISAALKKFSWPSVIVDRTFEGSRRDLSCSVEWRGAARGITEVHYDASVA